MQRTPSLNLLTAMDTAIQRRTAGFGNLTIVTAGSCPFVQGRQICPSDLPEETTGHSQASHQRAATPPVEQSHDDAVLSKLVCMEIARLDAQRERRELQERAKKKERQLKIAVLRAELEAKKEELVEKLRRLVETQKQPSRAPHRVPCAGHKKAGREGSLDFLASFDNLDQKSTPLIDQRKGVLSLGCDLRKRSHGLTSVMIQ